MKNKEIYGKYFLEITNEKSIEELIELGFYRLYSTWIKEKIDQFKNLVEGITKGNAKYTIIVPDRELLFDNKHDELCLMYKQYGRPATLLELAFFGAYFPFVQTHFLALFAFGSSIKDGRNNDCFPYLSYEMEDDGRMRIEKIPRKRGLKLCDDIWGMNSVHLPTGVLFVKWKIKK
ncbi:MAG: hypothetical protein ACOYL8_04925 [Patescibacteria group bacterium]